MGERYLFNCPDCGYKKQYDSGSGFFYYDNSLQEKSKKALFKRILKGYYGEEIKTAFKSHPIEEWNTEKVIGLPYPYYCPTCEKIRLRKGRTIWTENENGNIGEEIEIPEYYSVCKGELIFSTFHNFKCPKCGGHNAALKNVGLWD